MKMRHVSKKFVKRTKKAADNLDDLNDARLADKSWEEVLAGGILLTHEEMLIECDLK